MAWKPMPLYISPILLPTNTKQQWVLLVSKSVTSWASRNLCIAYNYTWIIAEFIAWQLPSSTQRNLKKTYWKLLKLFLQRNSLDESDHKLSNRLVITVASSPYFCSYSTIETFLYCLCMHFPLVYVVFETDCYSGSKGPCNHTNVVYNSYLYISIKCNCNLQWFW